MKIDLIEKSLNKNENIIVKNKPENALENISFSD